MILSLHGGHNASAALVEERDGRVVSWCVESERIDRVKMSCGCERYDGEDFSPQAKSAWIRSHKRDLTFLAEHVLAEAGAGPDQIGQVVLSQNVEPERLPAWLAGKPVCRVPHHQAHAALSYYTSGFSDALVIVCDGSGERLEEGFETQTAWSCEGGQMRQILGTYKRNTYQMGIGNAYELYTYWLGYGYNGCGTTMALASFDRGTPLAADRLFRMSENGDVFLNPDLINVEEHVKRCGYQKQGTMAYNQAHEAMLRSVPLPEGYRLRERGETSVQPAFIRMAGDIQHGTETAVLYYLDCARKKAPHSRVCLSGGTFLNCNLNSRIRALPWVEDIHVPTAPGDGGLALGGALAVYFSDHPLCPVEPTVYIGSRVKPVLLSEGDSLTARRLTDRYETAAELLAQGRLVGWCQGRAEFGPRALGHRSLLADPGRTETPDRINARLKHREAFRPFAPAVLEERFSDCFEGEMPIPFMLETRQVRPAWRERIPAVCHVDGSARVQVVSEKNCPEFYRLLKAFEKRTGLPVLVNTSLNRNGEPIVDSAEDALRILRKGMLDCLIVEDVYYGRKEEGAEDGKE